MGGRSAVGPACGAPRTDGRGARPEPGRWKVPGAPHATLVPTEGSGEGCAGPAGSRARRRCRGSEMPPSTVVTSPTAPLYWLPHPTPIAAVPKRSRRPAATRGSRGGFAGRADRPGAHGPRPASRGHYPSSLRGPSRRPRRTCRRRATAAHGRRGDAPGPRQGAAGNWHTVSREDERPRPRRLRADP